jgi:hypothetical protein
MTKAAEILLLIWMKCSAQRNPEAKTEAMPIPIKPEQT